MSFSCAGMPGSLLNFGGGPGASMLYRGRLLNVNVVESESFIQRRDKHWHAVVSA